MKQGIRKSVSWGGKAVMLALIAALALPTLFMGPVSAAEAKLQPALLAMAAEQPQATVRIIAQKMDPAADMEALVERLDGRVVRHLDIINAFVAEMSAGKARRLAASGAIVWVALDGPLMQTSSVGTASVRDEFHYRSYSNNDGGDNWAGDWIESGEYNNPFDGDIRISYDQLRLSDDHRSVRRAVNLAGAASATLSFDYRTEGFDSSSDYVAVEVSADGGASWSELDRFVGPSSGGSWYSMQSASYDISSYASGSTFIRFATSDYLGYRDYFYVDNVEVAYVMPPCPECVANTYTGTLNVQPVWDMGYQGQGIGIALIDSGVSADADFSHLTGSVAIGDGDVNDVYGHGTHVAGIVAGNGNDSGGWYRGIAPQANLINVAITGASGTAYESDVIAAMQWVYENKELYNIRVVNMSINSAMEQSYHDSPIDAAVEILWFNGVTVVASVGNKGSSTDTNTAKAAPANDPFIITVGASHEQGTADRSDDLVASFSDHATTLDGFNKPDIIAPGKDILSVTSAASSWAAAYPERAVLNGQYFRLSGTSMSAPMVSGAVALMLQADPSLTPDQVKYRLLNSGGIIGDGRLPYPYLDVYAAVTTPTTESANTGQIASQLLTTGSEPVNSSVSWNSVSWNSVSWNSVSWNSVSWNSVSWNSVSWNSVSWNSVSWDD